jgi:hypothetical protein
MKREVRKARVMGVHTWMWCVIDAGLAYPFLSWREAAEAAFRTRPLCNLIGAFNWVLYTHVYSDKVAA